MELLNVLGYVLAAKPLQLLGGWSGMKRYSNKAETRNIVFLRSTLWRENATQTNTQVTYIGRRYSFEAAIRVSPKQGFAI